MASDERPSATATLPDLNKKYGVIPGTAKIPNELNFQDGRFTEASLFDEPIPPVECAVSRLLPFGAPTLLVGEGGIGKTTLLAHVATCICTGRAFGGLAVTPGAVVILSLEDSRDQYRRRLRAIADSLVLTAQERRLLAERIYVYDVRGQGLYLTQPIHSAIEVHYDSIDVVARQCQLIGDVRLVAFETLSRFDRGGDENNNSHASVFIETADILALKTGAAILLTHHIGKAVHKQRGAQYSGRGASAFADNARSVIHLERMRYSDTKAPNGIAKEDFHEGRVFLLDHAKANLTQQAPPLVFCLRAGGDGPYVAHLDQAPRTAADRAKDKTRQNAADAQALAKYLTDNPGHYTKNVLERQKIVGNGRNRTRNAIDKGLDDGLLNERPLPAEERRGGRKTYLAVAEADSIPAAK